MIRRAFTMRLKPGALAEYKHHHDNLWPDLAAEIERAGIASISTFQRELDLCLVSEIHDEAAWDKLWSSEVHRRWAGVMEPLMHLRDDGIVESGELTEVFHFTTLGRGSEHFSLSAIAVVEPTSEANMQFDAEAIAESNPVGAPAVALAAPPSEPELAASAAYEAAPASAVEPAPASEPQPAPAPAPPARKKAVRRAKKAPAKKPAKKKAAKKKKAPAKKAKRAAAKRPKARAAAKVVRKPAKKAKAKKSAKKRVAPKKAKKAAKKKAGKKPAKKRRK